MKNRKSLILILLASTFIVSITNSQTGLDSVCLNIEYKYWEERDSQAARIKVSNGDSLMAIFCQLLWNKDSLKYKGISEYGALPAFGPNNFFSPNRGELRTLWDDPTGMSSSINDCELFFEVRFENKTGKVIKVNDDAPSLKTEFIKSNGTAPLNLSNCCNSTTSAKELNIVHAKLKTNPVSNWSEIQWAGTSVENYEVYDLSGKKVSENEELSKGVYIIVVGDRKKKIGIKLLVQ